mgnify:CR=1 FL=1
MVLDANGNPIMRYGDEVNPYLFSDLIEACVFAKSEGSKKNEPNRQIISVVEIIEIGRL